MPPPLTDAIASEIRAEMARQHLKSIDLATHMGRNRRTVWALLHGHQVIGLDDLESIATFLGVNPLELARRAA